MSSVARMTLSKGAGAPAVAFGMVRHGSSIVIDAAVGAAGRGRNLSAGTSGLWRLPVDGIRRAGIAWTGGSRRSGIFTTAGTIRIIARASGRGDRRIH